jgi:5-methylcytosine-specific restriction endonuclease McrA
MGGVVMTSMKQCSRCKALKSKAEFNKESKGKDGLRSECRSCQSVYKRELQDRNKAKNAQRAEFPEFKRCPKCGETKTSSEFYCDSGRADGLHGQCKCCVSAYKAANKLNKAVKNGYRKAVALGNHAEEFTGDDLEAHWLANDISAEQCHYCGVELATLEPRHQQLDHVHALNTGGPHTMENIVPACGACNNSKQDKPLEQFQTATS